MDLIVSLHDNKLVRPICLPLYFYTTTSVQMRTWARYQGRLVLRLRLFVLDIFSTVIYFFVTTPNIFIDLNQVACFLRHALHIFLELIKEFCNPYRLKCHQPIFFKNDCSLKRQFTKVSHPNFWICILEIFSVDVWGYFISSCNAWCGLSFNAKMTSSDMMYPGRQTMSKKAQTWKATLNRSNIPGPLCNV